MKPTLLVLAAGMGSRYKGLKQVDPFGPSGETILEYAVYDAARAGFGKVVFVLRKEIEDRFKALFFDKMASKIEVDYVLQEMDNLPEGFTLPEGREKPWGTGHAVLCAADKIDTPFAVINADDFYGAEAFLTLSEHLKLMGNRSDTFFLAGYRLDNTLSAHGHVARGICEVSPENTLLSITERTKILRQPSGQIVYLEDEEPHSLKGDETVSMNLFGFPASVFPHFKKYFVEFLENSIHEPKSEFYIPTVVNLLIASGQAQVKVLPVGAKWFGVTYREDKEEAVGKIAALVQAGAYPPNLWKS